VTEAPYSFREYLETVHKVDQRDPDAMPREGEVIIDASWAIAIGEDAPKLVWNVARDLQDYFAVSMGLDLVVGRHADIAGLATHGERKIVLGTAGQVPGVDGVPDTARGYRFVVEPDRIVLCGRDDRGTAQASYHLEDLLNLRGAPFLAPRDETRTPIFSPRMTHSGWGLDEFPDPYLNQIAHHGMDAILVFASDVNRTPDENVNRNPGPQHQGRHNDFNAIVDRAEEYGLDVYLYAYPHGKKPLHPDDPGAERFYEETFGALFAACPRAKGLILVGESVEFPSKDPRTTGRLRLDPSPDRLPASKPTPGWWPCIDYPEWVSLVTKVVRKHSPDAEIVFWTYNWGYAPEEDRLALLRALPTDITLQATFEMFEPIRHDGVTNVCVDYTVASVGPGTYFASEAAVAHERGIPLYTMANTGGLTWDFGVIPYQPVPQQWSRRHAALRRAHDDWGLSGVMESHHFGWWPSIVSEVAKANYWEPVVDSGETIAAIAARDFGVGADQAVAAWQAWSDATTDYIPTNEDQYGPFRIGPAYPLSFLGAPKLPVSEFAMFGDMIVTTPYNPENGARRNKTAAAIRIDAEISALTRMKAKWEEGVRLLEEAIALAPAHKAERNQRMLTLGHYIPHAIQTTINTKQWWKLRTRIMVEDDPATAGALLDDLAAVGEAEIANCEAAIPVVEADSRLGWEPTMEYLGDAAHIRWKIAHLQHALGHEIPAYRASLTL
jgi:hypothetical protein